MILYEIVTPVKYTGHHIPDYVININIKPSTGNSASDQGGEIHVTVNLLRRRGQPAGPLCRYCMQPGEYCVITATVSEFCV